MKVFLYATKEQIQNLTVNGSKAKYSVSLTKLKPSTKYQVSVQSIGKQGKSKLATALGTTFVQGE